MRGGETSAHFGKALFRSAVGSLEIVDPTGEGFTRYLSVELLDRLNERSARRRVLTMEEQADKPGMVALGQAGWEVRASPKCPPLSFAIADESRLLIPIEFDANVADRTPCYFITDPSFVVETRESFAAAWDAGTIASDDAAGNQTDDEAWRATVSELTGARGITQYEYDVALSFAGEDRTHARSLADRLTGAGYSVFFDEYEKADLWGKDLVVHLFDIYSEKSRYCVLFASEHYARKVWTNHERRAAQQRAIAETRHEYILPVRVDDTTIPGLPRTTAYLDISIGPDAISALLVKKLAAEDHGRGPVETKSRASIVAGAAVEGNSQSHTDVSEDETTTDRSGSGHVTVQPQERTVFGGLLKGLHAGVRSVVPASIYTLVLENLQKLPAARDALLKRPPWDAIRWIRKVRRRD